MNKRSHPEHEAPRDPVTGLPTIDTVRGRIEDWLAQSSAAGEPVRVHVLLLGLRRLDAVNLAFGASVGDAALAEVAGRISRFAEHELDGPWLVARGSGGNFLLAADETCSRERWQLFAEHLADRIARPIPAAAGALRLSPKLALLRWLPDENVESMLDRLGQTLSSNRRLQGQRIVWADGEAVPPGRTAAQLEADLLGAIDRDEIEIVFQPQFALADDRLSGAEALARWQHPTLGRIGAAALFSIAERVDHLVPLSRHIAHRALAAATHWPGELRLSLNITPADLAAGSYAELLLGILSESGFAANRVTLEVIEQSLLGDLQLAAETLRFLTARGIRIALDDFGAGFCNFRYLKLLPLHYLKLDRSMVEGIASDPRDLAVLRAIVAMAGALGLQVIAEGVENEAQRAKIAEEGCAFYQGFLRAQPMTAAEFLRLAGS
jgi:EAL domain-containing protein (putative c-di-GMP-specific phosphodiesterase class I)/GGDEF domain-containing protein